MTDTLHGTGKPDPDLVSLIPPPAHLPSDVSGDPIQSAIEHAFAPVIQTWERRSQDMLDVLADSSLARAEVRRGVGTIRLAAMLGVLAMVAGGLAVWTTLQSDRAERRAVRQLDERAREAAWGELSRRLASVCPARGQWGAGATDSGKAPPGPGKP